MTIEHELVAKLLADVLGAETRHMVFEAIVQRHGYQVVIASDPRSSARVVVKLAGAEAPHWASADAFERLPMLTLLLERQRVTVPKILALDTSCQRWPVRYVITSFLPGVTWAVARPALSSADVSVLFGELGEIVARVHAIGFDTFGDFDPLGGVCDGASYRDALGRRAARRVHEPRRVELFQGLIDKYADALDCVVSPALTHEDLNHTNLVVSHGNGGWHLAGLLDFDSAWAGNPESDLAKLGLWRGMQHPTFWAAYTSERGQLPPDSATRLPLLQLLWCLEYAQPTPEHHAVTASVCAGLGIAPIRFDA